MAYAIRRVDYYYVTVKDEPGVAYELLSQLAGLGINLLAFSAIPIGPNSSQLTLFPESSMSFQQKAKLAGLHYLGPHHAFLVSGDDQLGALAEAHNALYRARVNIYASYGITDGKGDYGYLIYVKPEDYEHAAKALGI
jgi:predicted amino acid-binding ACT domain protein